MMTPSRPTTAQEKVRESMDVFYLMNFDLPRIEPNA